ncbi:MAG: methyltransferase domain-containing protein [Coxiellaceae bacterium]|jgi:malonyl-CoA O-methyltransferase|nr:methyltransferase domain-containing protein [Coxiellaceae bacterium]
MKSFFDKASETYDSVAEVQILSSAHLSSMIKNTLRNSTVNSILDIGCGTGNTSLEVMKIYPNADYTLCDVSEKMLHKAQVKLNIYGICADAETYNFTKKYSLIISNLAMQWFESIDFFLRKNSKNCRYFAFSTLLNTSFRIFDKSAITYPSLEKMKFLCKKHSKLLGCDIQRYELQFKNPFGLARYFRKLGAITYPSKKLLTHHHKIILNYDIFFGIVDYKSVHPERS